MPITKSAKKKVRQAKSHFERNQATRTKLKTYVKKIMTLSKSKPEDAKKLLATAYSVIDTAQKKNLIHKNTAARKKALLAKLAGGNSGKKMGAKGEKKAAATKKKA